MLVYYAVRHEPGRLCPAVHCRTPTSNLQMVSGRLVSRAKRGPRIAPSWAGLALRRYQWPAREGTEMLSGPAVRHPAVSPGSFTAGRYITGSPGRRTTTPSPDPRIPRTDRQLSITDGNNLRAIGPHRICSIAVGCRLSAGQGLGLSEERAEHVLAGGAGFGLDA